MYLDDSKNLVCNLRDDLSSAAEETEFQAFCLARCNIDVLAINPTDGANEMLKDFFDSLKELNDKARQFRCELMKLRALFFGPRRGRKGAPERENF